MIPLSMAAFSFSSVHKSCISNLLMRCRRRMACTRWEMAMVPPSSRPLSGLSLVRGMIDRIIIQVVEVMSWLSLDRWRRGVALRARRCGASQQSEWTIAVGSESSERSVGNEMRMLCRVKNGPKIEIPCVAAKYWSKAQFHGPVPLVWTCVPSTR